MTKPRIGSRWRVLAHGRKGSVELYSHKHPHRYPTDAPHAPHEAVFDELVIDRFFHLEQMSTRTWWVRIGDRMLMFTVKRDGSVEIGEWYLSFS